METLIDLVSKISGFLNSFSELISPSDNLYEIASDKFTAAYDTVSSLVDFSSPDSIANSIIPIALVLMSVVFLLNLAPQIARSNFDAETLIRSFIKFIIGVILISNVNIIITFVFDFGDAVVGDITTNFKSANSAALSESSNWEAIAKSMEDGNIILTSSQVISFIGKFLAQWVGVAIIQLILVGVAYSRAIKLAIYQVLLPFELCDIFTRGIYSGAVRFIKKLAALYLQYPLCLLIIGTIDILSNQITVSFGNWMAYMGQVVMILICAGKLIKDSANEAEDIFG